MLPTDKQTDSFFAIIVAGGSGSRMQSDVPKQFLLLQGKPILQHTIERFLSVSFFGPGAVIHIILVLPDRDLLYWEQLCNEHNFHPPIQTVTGGATRFQSVRNGLNAIMAAEGLVAVHDGVRPFVSPEIIINSYETAARTGSAVACVPLNDSVRVIGNDGVSRAVDRRQYRLIQTPQTFQLAMFRQSFQVEEQPFFTDCASVVEHAGFSVTLIDGAYENIKITTPEDLR